MSSFRILASLLALGLAAPSWGVDLDWQAHADADVVEVITTDEDGATREHPIWLVVVDGTGFIRTGGSTWGQNISRTGALALRIGETTLALSGEAVEDDALRARIDDAFRAKYGFQDRMVSWFRGDRPRIFRLAPATAVGPA